MGSMNTWDDRQTPQHTVYIPYDYWIGRYPITVDQFTVFVDYIEANFPSLDYFRRGSNVTRKGNHPVSNMSWDIAMSYCKWLNAMQGKELPKGFVFRLPTEAEWEKAARGEFGFEWPWGNEFDKNKCNTEESGKDDTTPVGAYSPAGDSPYGAADMVGNVWEWTQSLNKDYPYDAKDGREDLQSRDRRVLRGGSFNSDLSRACCTFRSNQDPRTGSRYVGFRVVVAPSIP